MDIFIPWKEGNFKPEKKVSFFPLDMFWQPKNQDVYLVLDNHNQVCLNEMIMPNPCKLPERVYYLWVTVCTVTKKIVISQMNINSFESYLLNAWNIAVWAHHRVTENRKEEGMYADTFNFFIDLGHDANTSTCRFEVMRRIAKAVQGGYFNLVPLLDARDNGSAVVFKSPPPLEPSSAELMTEMTATIKDQLMIVNYIN